jgi:hypothetical protein
MRMQNGGSGLTPPPRTNGDSTAARNFPNVAARVCRTSDVSEREKKRERLGLVAAMVCFSTASKGSFYRHGTARESGFQILAEAGKILGTAAPSLTFG